MVQPTVKYDAEILARLRAFRAANEQLKLQHYELLEKYPDQWVAMSSDGVVVAAHKDLLELMKMYDREERQRGRIAIQLMETDPMPVKLAHLRRADLRDERTVTPAGRIRPENRPAPLSAHLGHVLDSPEHGVGQVPNCRGLILREHTMATTAGADEIREMIQQLLGDRFRGDLEFGPIVVVPRIDFDGIEFLQSYIVFSGGQDKLDPRWTLRLSDSLWDRSV